MKIIVVFILIAVGVFLFLRAQRLAKEEQEAMKPKSTTVKPVVPTEEVPISSAAEPERVEPEPVEQAEDTRVVEVEPVIEVEAELMPRETNEPANISVELDTDIIEVDIPAAHNEEAVIILGTTPTDEQADVKTEAEPASSTRSEVGAPGAWANVTLVRAFEEYQGATSASARYTALQNMVAECYKQRKSADYLNYGAQYLCLARR